MPYRHRVPQDDAGSRKDDLNGAYDAGCNPAPRLHWRERKVKTMRKLDGLLSPKKHLARVMTGAGKNVAVEIVNSEEEPRIMPDGRVQVGVAWFSGLRGPLRLCGKNGAWLDDRCKETVRFLVHRIKGK